MRLLQKLREGTTLNLHNKLAEKSSIYSTWDKNPIRNHIHWGVLVVYLVVFSSISLTSFHTAYSAPKILGFDNKNARNESAGGQVEFIEMEVGEILSHGRSKDLIPTNLSGKKVKLKFVPDSGIVSSIEYDDVVIDGSEPGLGASVLSALKWLGAVAGRAADGGNGNNGNGNNNTGGNGNNNGNGNTETPPAAEPSQPVTADDDIEIALDEPETPPGWDKVLAVGDVKGFTFSKGRFKKVAQGKDLFKCLNWNYENQQCLGRWQKIAKLVPGQEYTVEFAPGDPGYAESSRKINALNKKNELLDYIETASTPETPTVVLTPATSTVSTSEIEAIPVQEITISQIDETSPNNDLIVDVVDVASDPVVQEAIVIDTTNLAAAVTTVTNKAKSSVLVGCVNYQETDNTCARWKKERNIVPEEDYVISISSPGRSVFGQSKDGILVLDKNLEVLPQALQALDAGNASVQFADMNPYKITTYSDAANAGTTEEIIVDGFNQGSENSNGKTMSFDLSSSTVNSADIDATAVGYDLFHCDDFDLENQTCRGKYKKSKDLRRNENYSFSIEKQDGVSEFFESKKRISLLDKENGLFSYTENVVSTETGTDVEIIPTEVNIIKKIKVKNLIENTGNDLKINESVQPPREDALQSYAVDPTGLGTDSELEVEAKGNSLYKCKDWDFTNSACLGTWEKIKTLEPGTTYTLAIDQADPGFMEVNEAPDPVPAPVATPKKRSSSGGRSSGGYTSQTITYNQGSTAPATTTTSSATPTTSPTTTLSTTTTTANTISNKVPAITTAPKIEFKKDLKFGSWGLEIKELQQFLNKNGFLVTKIGPGSPGQETNYFGPLTKAALMKFQQAYASKILAPAGLKAPTGILGPLTKEFINSLRTLQNR